MIKDIVFNFLDYIEEKFHFVSKDLQLVMCYETYLEFYTEIGYDYPIQLGYDDNKNIETYYGMAIRKDEEALPGLIYIVKDKIVLGVFKII